MSLRPHTTYHYHSQVRRPLKFSLKIARLLVLLLSPTCFAIAQAPAGSTDGFNPAAYRIGERLTYNVDFSRFISAAHVELLIAGRGNFFGRDGIQLKAHVETTGVVNVALLSMNNDYTTYVAAESGLPYRRQQVVREAGRTSEASVDYNQPAGTDALPAKLRLGEFQGTYDLLSVLYRIRALPLTPGSTYFTTVRNDAQEYHAEIKVIGKELIKTNVGSFDAVVTRVNLKGGPDYGLRVYFSDDEWHVPVLMTARSDSADIHVELAGSELTPPSSNQPSRTIVEPANTLPTPTPVPVRPVNPVVTPPSSLARWDLPFNVGEVLNFQVYLGNGTQPVGSITFVAKNRGRYFNRDGLQLSASAQTVAGAVYPVRDQMTSYVDPATLLPFRTEINFSEGRWRNLRNYDLDQDRGAAVSESPRERIEIPVGTHDLLSAFYALRSFDLSLQKPNAISILIDKRPRALTVKAIRREILDLNGQKVPAIMLQLTTDDQQSDRLQLRIWVGDDARRLPLRITAATDLGAAHADLAIVPANPK